MFSNKLDKLLESLERIATALEVQNGISNFPSDIFDKKSSKLEMFDSKGRAEENNKIDEELEKALEKGTKGGFFFEEDAISQELLERM